MSDGKQHNRQQDRYERTLKHINLLIDLLHSNEEIEIVSIVSANNLDTSTYHVLSPCSSATILGLMEIGRMLSEDVVFGEVEDDE